MRSVFSFVILFFSLTAFTQNSQPTPTASPKTESFQGGLIELALPTGNIDSTIDSELIGASYTNPSPFSLNVGLGMPGPNYRAYLGLSFERLGTLTVGAKEQSLLMFGFKLTYDRTFKPMVTDVFLSGSFQFLPIQGAHFSTNGTEFSPDFGMGMEASIGWISPWDIAFNLGYKAVFKNYSFQRGNPITGNMDKELSSVGYSGLFLTTSIGRY